MTGSGADIDPDPGAEPATRRRLWWWLTIAGAAVALGVIGILVALAVAGQPAPPGEGAAGGPSATAGESPDPDGAAAPGDGDPADPGATIDPDFGEPVADTAVGDGEADFGDSVTAKVTAIDFITVTGTRAGEVSGPAMRVAVMLANGTGEPIPLDAVTVNAYYGSDTQPASPFDSETEGEPFSGTLASGGTATGSYVFSIPEGQDKDIVVTVSRGADSPLVVFRR